MKLIFLLFPFFIFSQITSGKFSIAKNAKIFYEIEVFEKENHSFKFCEHVGGKYLCEIDGENWFGSDYGVQYPKNQLTKLVLILKGKKYGLKISKMFNPNFSGHLSEIQFKLKKFGNYYRLYSFFSDGAGSYSVYWKIYPTKSIREIISNEEKYFEWQLQD